MKRLKLNLSLTSVIVLLAVGVLLPVILSTAAGIVTVVVGDETRTIILGVLVICFALAAAGAVIVAVVLTGRKNLLARRQADFVAGVTHELRTPLSAIRLHAQTLESGSLEENPAEQKKCLDTILRETEWLAILIDEVLTWRTASRKPLPLNMIVDSIGPAVEDAATRFRSMVPEDEVDFRVDATSKLRITHDPKALRMAIVNLLTNAYKYTDKDKIIELRTLDREGKAMIEVVDNGVGLSKRDKRRVLQPFFRVTRALGGASGSIGLGLAIVRELVRQHKGEIEIDSEEGAGSTFRICLPETKEANDSQL